MGGVFFTFASIISVVKVLNFHFIATIFTRHSLSFNTILKNNRTARLLDDPSDWEFWEWIYY